MLVNTRLVALCANHDSVAADEGALAKAAAVYKDLLGSISSLEDAEKKIAELGSQGKIDPAFLQARALRCCCLAVLAVLSRPVGGFR